MAFNSGIRERRWRLLYALDRSYRRPFEFGVAAGSFVKIEPPRSGRAQATGIYAKDEIVGWLAGPSGAKGVIFNGGVYRVVAGPKSTSTQALVLNF
jgi:hypothetical protein